MLESFKKVEVRLEGEIFIASIEEKLKNIIPTKELLEIFGEETYLIGGAVRDVIFDKKPYDFDLMSRQSLDITLEKLKRLGYSESAERKFEDGKFFIKLDPVSNNHALRAGIINLSIRGKEIQVGLIGETSIEHLISLGDINLSCCAYNVSTGKIINSELVEEIRNREIKFTNPEEAKKDPIKILNALKQISRFPDLKINIVTKEIIKESIQLFVSYFTDNQDKRYKLSAIFGNINTSEVLQFFDGYDTSIIFDGLEQKKNKLIVTLPYFSKNINELDGDFKTKISNFVRDKFGKRFEESKLFNDKVNSVVYELDKNNELLCCCLVDNERLYATASKNSELLINLVENLCKNNYNIWSTVSINSKLLIAMSEKADLKIVKDPKLIEKILVGHYPQYKDHIVIEQKGEYNVFHKDNSDESPQVLLTS